MTPTTPFDEPLWLVRSTVLPSDVSTADYRAWSVDVPAVNRWVYYAVLHATGLDKVPPGERRCWSMRGGDLYWYNERLPDWVKDFYAGVYTLDWWERNFGVYAPRGAIMAMRYTNTAVFVLFAVFLWLAAETALRSRVRATLAVLPVLLTPTCLAAVGISFVTWSGDVFMAAGIAAGLFVWLRYHLSGRGASLPAILVVSVLSGLAAASKHSGVLFVAAYAAYLALYARGFGRLLRPLVSLAVAACVVALTNPVLFLYPDASPWEVLRLAAERRAYILDRQLTVFQPSSLVSLVRNAFYWWPVAPACLAAIWSCRRERWFAPVAFWGGFLAVGAGVGLLRMRVMQERYLLPVLVGFGFVSSVCIMTSARALANHLLSGRTVPAADSSGVLKPLPPPGILSSHPDR